MLSLVMHAASRGNTTTQKGNEMAEDEPLLTSPPTQEAAVHVRDYTRFIKMVKWTAIICFIIGLGVVMLISS